MNDYVTLRKPGDGQKWNAFERFPEWMWRNHEVLEFVEWLRDFNLTNRDRHQRVGWYGVDLYSLYTSIRAVLGYLQKVDPESAELARERYSCLTAWEPDPQSYGRAAVMGQYRSCEQDAVTMLKDLLASQMEYARYDGEYFMDAALNAKLIADAEKYYRVMYRGGDESWNLRDQHMFETLESLLDFHGRESRAILWAHNSHLGDDAATEMGRRGQINLGHLCRKHFGDSAYLIGQLTDRGTVAAAPFWDEPMEVMQVRPSHEESYERVLHDTGLQQAFLPLRATALPGFKERLGSSRMERAIGVIYRPRTELQSHYFEVSLPEQFDEVIWFDTSSAVKPFDVKAMDFDPAHHPFALVD
ncbi:erythromycin esterase family protein [Rubinisphaera sp. ICM_H10]|nr:erythromycin esterase family protein [Rubinisphaera margarita]